MLVGWSREEETNFISENKLFSLLFYIYLNNSINTINIKNWSRLTGTWLKVCVHFIYYLLFSRLPLLNGSLLLIEMFVCVCVCVRV